MWPSMTGWTLQQNAGPGPKLVHGLPDRRRLALHRSRQAPAERLGRRLQRQVPPRVPERRGVHDPGKSTGRHRPMAGHDYNHVRAQSAHGGLASETVRLNHAAGRLRDVNSCAACPLPSEPKMSYEACGLPI